MTKPTAQHTELRNGSLTLYTHFMPPHWVAGRLEQWLDDIPWEQKPIRLFGKEFLQPRLTAWYGDAKAQYTYSGLVNHPLPWTEDLLILKEAIEAQTGHTFNSVLLNAYRNGADSMGMHKDNEPELGTNPIIASYTLGAERPFTLVHDDGERHKILLPHNSLLVMSGALQHHWKHGIAKSKRIQEPRINATFRKVFSFK